MKSKLLLNLTSNREIILYLFFGVLTTIVNVSAFAVCFILFAINELIANVIAWILAVLFAFFTNRIWVFSAPTKGFVDFTRQMAAFFAGRLATLGVEELILLVFVTWLACNALVVKVIASVIVIVLNYVVSKYWVFGK